MFDNNCECNKDKYKLPNGCFLMGPTGPTGPMGPASITVGITNTGLPNTKAIVSNSGTNDNVILDFVIPQGPTARCNKSSIYIFKW